MNPRQLILILSHPVLFFAHSNFVKAQDTTILDSLNFAEGRIIPGVRIWVDQSSNIPIAQIPEEGFQSLNHLNDTTLQYVHPGKSTWLQLSLQNNSKEDSLLLYVGEFDHIELFSKNGKLLSKAGLLLNYSRPYPPNKRMVLIQLHIGESELLFVKVRNEIRSFRNRLSPEILTPASERAQRNALNNARRNYLLFNGFFFGAIGLFFLFTLFQYLHNQDSGYGWYIAYLGCVLVYYLRLFEANADVDFLFAHITKWYYWWEAPLAFFGYLTYMAFVVAFLDLRRTNSRIVKVFWWTGCLIVAHFILDWGMKFFGWMRPSYDAYFWLRSFYVAISLYVIVEIFRMRSRLSKFIMIGTSCLIIGGGTCMALYIYQGNGDTSIFNDMVLLQQSNVWDIPIFYMQLGILGEVLFFSIGLGYRNKRIWAERNETQGRLIKTLEEEVNLKQQLAETALKLAKAQIKPHFIDNVLSSIRSLIEKRQANEAAAYLTKFSRLLRYMLDYSNERSIPLEKEIEFSRSYLELEAFCTPHHFECEIFADPSVDMQYIRIPPMLLQPYLENAIHHGLREKVGDKRLTLTILTGENETVKCTVDDNGIGREASRKKQEERGRKEASHGTRLAEQLRQLHKELMDSEIEIFIIDKEDIKGNSLGTRVEVLIPY